MVSMDTSNSSARLSGSSSSCIPQSDTRSSVPELADGNSIQVLSSSDSEDQLSDHNEDEAQSEVVSAGQAQSTKSFRSGKKTKSSVKPSCGYEAEQERQEFCICSKI